MRSTGPIRVIVVEDHHFFRSGLVRLLSDAGISVVADASSAETALPLAAVHHPDVVIMDLHLPGMSGIAATLRLGQQDPAPAVLVLTVSAEEDDVIDALLAGADGYLLKDATIDEIIAGIRAAAAGATPLAPPVARQIVERVRQPRRPAATALPTLTPREQEVLRLLAAGEDNLAIAKRLVISQSTVKNHVASILSKLGVDNRIQAAVRAVGAGLV